MKNFIILMVIIFSLTACKSMQMSKNEENTKNKEQNNEIIQEDIEVKEELTISKPKEKKVKNENKEKKEIIKKEIEKKEIEKKEIFQECKKNSDCKNNICLAFENDKYRCSKKCSSDEDCINTKLPICDDWIKKCRVKNK